MGRLCQGRVAIFQEYLSQAPVPFGDDSRRVSHWRDHELVSEGCAYCRFSQQKLNSSKLRSDMKYTILIVF